jgi:hypothetical protein
MNTEKALITEVKSCITAVLNNLIKLQEYPALQADSFTIGESHVREHK